MKNKELPFNANQFTATEFYDAEAKARFANALVEFILGGFSMEDFNKSLYQRLSNCFMHIAHYDREGFYTTWFDNPKQIRSWLERTKNAQVFGDSKFTFSDVEKEIQSWIAANQDLIQSVLEGRDVRTQELAANAGTEQIFRIVAISNNSGSFGHKRHILVCKTGIGVSGDRQPNYNNPTLRDLQIGEELTFTVDSDGIPTNWYSHGFEFMKRLRPDPPADACVEVFSTDDFCKRMKL